MSYYLYRIKRLLRNKMLFFWTIVFPLLLATVFKVVFSEIAEKDWGFETLSVAVTVREGNGEDEAFVAFLKEMKNEKVPFFEVTECDRETARELLADKKISAVIEAGEEMKLIFRGNGINSTIIKNVVDGYLQSKDIFIQAAMTGKLEEVTKVFSEEIQTLTERPFEGASKDPFVQYFQALLAMASLYGAMYGLYNINEMNQKITDVAARRLIAPMKIAPTVLGDVAAAFTIQYFQFIISIVYFTVILQVDFGTVNGLLLGTGALQSLLGVLLGYFIGSIVREKENLQNSIMMSGVMFSCFLAGLMVGNMRIFIELSVPIVNRINPASLIADSMQALCIMGDMKQYARCMLGMLVWCVCLGGGSILVMKLRQRAMGRSVEEV